MIFIFLFKSEKAFSNLRNFNVISDEVNSSSAYLILASVA